MSGQIHWDIISKQHVYLFSGTMGAEFAFMDEHDRPHQANIVNKLLLSEEITCMEWPAFSPDLDPIDHVWDLLGRRAPAC